MKAKIALPFFQRIPALGRNIAPNTANTIPKIE
jgi:hypothetical protein